MRYLKSGFRNRPSSGEVDSEKWSQTLIGGHLRGTRKKKPVCFYSRWGVGGWGVIAPSRKIPGRHQSPITPLVVPPAPVLFLFSGHTGIGGGEFLCWGRCFCTPAWGAGSSFSMSTHPAPPCRATYLAPECSVGQRSRGRRSLPLIVMVLAAAFLVVCAVYSDGR